jgi:tRNA (guanine-N7-)-methyltransferase
MRMRRKPWARPALDACDFFINDPTNYVGRWKDSFKKQQDIWLELGCGKGGFISKMAVANQDINFIAIDIKDAVLALAMKNIEKEYAAINAPIDNIKLMSYEIMIIHNMLSEKDKIKRIYINFCNPWYKGSDRTRRLTHPHQLMQYSAFLEIGGEIRFKTDDAPLFLDSRSYFKQCGFNIKYETEDLHNSGYSENIETEHEQMYKAQGLKINFLIAEKIK